MKIKSTNSTRTLIILNVAVIAVIIYIISIYRAFPIFQMNRLIDPLAELHSLSVLYYAALVLVALASVACLVWRCGNKYLHIGLLIIFAIMLWLTPYLLSGFVRYSDSSWHVGIATKIPQILAGDKVTLSWYG